MRLREAVRIEIRAAEIAAGMIHALWHDMALEELGGWMRYGDNREGGDYPKSSSWQAGWLAAYIYAGERPVTIRHDLIATASSAAAAVTRQA